MFFRTMRDIVDSVDEDTKSITKQWHGDSEEEYEWKEIPSNKPKWDCESIRSKLLICWILQNLL